MCVDPSYVSLNSPTFFVAKLISRWLGLTLDMIGSVIVFTSITVASLLSSTGPAGMGLLISYSLLIPIYLAWVVKFVADIENYMNAVERVLEYTELEPEEDHKKYPQRIDTYYDKGNISFDGVYLGYHLDSRVVIGTQTRLSHRQPGYLYLHIWFQSF